MFLTSEEVIDLTHKKHRSAQICALRCMGIEHRIRPDGSVAVLRSYIEKILGAGDSNNGRIKPEIEPNWSAVDAKNA